MSDGALAGNDVERLATHTPPRLRHLAVGDEALVQDVFFADSLGPFAFEMKGIVGGQHPGLGDDLRTGFANHIVKLAGLLVGIVCEVVAPHFHVAFEIVEEDVAAGAHVARVLIEIDLVGAEKHRRTLDFGGRAG